jgi:ribosomal-protein-alanine N-acetyltransferase
VCEVLRFGFEAMRLNCIQAACEPDNTASSRVLEKVGMTYEGTLREHAFDKRHEPGQQHAVKVGFSIRDGHGAIRASEGSSGQHNAHLSVPFTQVAPDIATR